jgi:hypothetical protein
MERVETLCNLLAEKLQNKASINELLSTVKMMESELLHLKNITPTSSKDVIPASVNISKQIIPQTIYDEADFSMTEPEKIVEVLQIDEAEVEAELEEIKKNAEVRNSLGYQNRPPVSFEEIDEIPTLVNRQNIFDASGTKDAIKELNEILPTNNAASLNDVLSNPIKEINHALNAEPVKELNEILDANTISLHETQLQNINETAWAIETKPVSSKLEVSAKEIHEVIKEASNINDAKELNEILPINNTTSINDLHNIPVNELSDAFEDAPIKDLKKAIGINERFLYLNELFRGDETMYERSIKTINAFSIYPEAEFWIRRELKLKLGWDDKYNTVKQFDQLVRRRFL